MVKLFPSFQFTTSSVYKLYCLTHYLVLYSNTVFLALEFRSKILALFQFFLFFFVTTCCCLGTPNMVFVSWTLKPACFEGTSGFTAGAPRLPNLLLLLTLTAVSFHVFFVVCVCELIFHGVAFAERPHHGLDGGSVCHCRALGPRTLRTSFSAQTCPHCVPLGAGWAQCVPVSLCDSVTTHRPAHTLQFWTPQWIVFLDILREKMALS